MKAKCLIWILSRVLKMNLYRIDSADGSYSHVWSWGPVCAGNPTQVNP